MRKQRHRFAVRVSGALTSVGGQKLNGLLNAVYPHFDNVRTVHQVPASFGRETTAIPG